MFDELTGRLVQVFRGLHSRGKLTEANVREALREVRRALLAADVHVDVARDFVGKMETDAIGQQVLSSISPGQQVIKVVHDGLVELLGESAVELRRSPKPPTVLLLVGLQGSGKTTLAAKLAARGRRAGERVLLVAADLARPAAIDQLEVLGKESGVEVFARRETTDAPAVVREALRAAGAHDSVIVDTAGRLHIDQELMAELEAMKAAAKPTEILLVLDAMTGQDAVRTAQAFDRELGIDGVVLTKLDGDARGGAALSIRAVTGKPIKLISVGERLEALEAFHPERMASRILGMGDVVSLVERAEAVVDEEEAERLEAKLRREGFSLDDFLSQLRQLKKLGPLEDLLKLIPGMGSLAGLKVDDQALRRIEGMICSMTLEERRRPQILNASRRKRIAAGSGTTVQDLNRLLKQFSQVQDLMKRMGSGGFGGMGGSGRGGMGRLGRLGMR